MNTSGLIGNGPETVSLWYYPNSFNPGMCAFNYGGNSWGTYFDISLNWFSAQTPNPCYGLSFVAEGTGISWGSTIQSSSNWHHVVIIVPSGATDLNSLIAYVDGSLITTTCSFANYGAPNLNFSNVNPIKIGQSWGSQNSFQGKIDDIGIWNRVLTPLEIATLYQNCSLSITTNPSNQNVTVGNNVQFTVISSDSSSTYHWQTDLGLGFQNISNAGQYSGATDDTLILSNTALLNNNQHFRCILTDGSCTDTSTSAVLTVNPVGINEVSEQNLFSLFPNPTTSKINVKANATLVGSVYTIYDQIGKSVLSGKITSENIIIELGNLSEGIYLFSIGNNIKQKFKVSKQ